MKYIAILTFIFFSLSAKDINIIGTWNLTNTKHPFTCCSLVSYDIVLKFTKNNTIELIKHGTQIFDTKRHYKLEGNKLNIYLENKNIGFLGNLFMKNSSTNKTFIINQINNKCFQAIQTKNKSNLFIMCKI